MVRNREHDGKSVQISTFGKSAAAVILLLLLAPAHPVFGETSSSPAGDNASPQILPAWMERVHFHGLLEPEFSWSDKADPPDRNGGSSSEIFLRRVEFGAGVEMTDWLTADLFLKDEYVGTDQETGLKVDKATMTFHQEGSPFFLVVGKRVQPFGTFVNYLVEDPMTKDAYETRVVGVTVEYEGPMGLILSATGYSGDEMMTHLFKSGLFDTEVITRMEEPPDEASSYILAASVQPVDGPITVSGAFLSEAGAGNRNDTFSIAAHFETNAMKGFRMDGEYMKAVARERYVGFDREFLEGVVSLTAAYEVVLKEREVVGGSIFTGNRAHTVVSPLTVAARYEYFDDDGMASASQSYSVKERWSLGARYSFYRDPETGLDVYLASEFRHTGYRVYPSPGDDWDDANEEFFTRLGLAF